VIPVIKHGIKTKLRARNKNGRIRKLRSDKGKKRNTVNINTGTQKNIGVVVDSKEV